MVRTGEKGTAAARRRPRVFMTGASGGMGMASLKQMLPDVGEAYDLVVLVRDSEKNRSEMAPFEGTSGLEVVWGDLDDNEAVRCCLLDTDLVLHIAAFVSPAADYHPKKAMHVNFGGTKRLVDTIHKLGQDEKTAFVYIGTVAETGDRMPPIHWGRVGDPIKPSMFDYYAVSKVAAERYVIESGLARWASLRQTGIIGPAMVKIRDAIQFHNCLYNVLEYCSDRDSGRAMAHLAEYDVAGTLDPSFWCHVYNIGGGAPCRVSTIDMYRKLYGELGFTSLDPVIDNKYVATRNFHGQYYLDSDKLEGFLHFRSDSMQYFYDEYLKAMGPAAIGFARFLCRIPGGQHLMGSVIKKSTFDALLDAEHGTRHFIQADMDDRIDAYWGSRAAWEKLPEKVSDMPAFTDWDHVVHIDHGYDESKPEEELSIEDMRGAAEFRGGKLLSTQMCTGDWRGKLRFRCAFGHEFEASPRLVLEGGHWCPVCEAKSWNYGARAKVDPFFAQVWNPLHSSDEMREYPKEC